MVLCVWENDFVKSGQIVLSNCLHLLHARTHRHQNEMETTFFLGLAGQKLNSHSLRDKFLVYYFFFFGLFSFLFATLRIYLCISLIYVLTFVEQKKIVHIFIELFFFISLLAHWCEYVCGCVSERERLCVRVHGEFDKSIRMTVQFLCSMLSWMTVKWAAAPCNSAICPVHTYGAQMRNKKYSIDKKVNKRMQKLAKRDIRRYSIPCVK